MSKSKSQFCSECKSESEHNLKLLEAQRDYHNFKQINLLNLPPDDNGDDYISISLSDYSYSDDDDDQDLPSCECLKDITNEERELFMLPLEYVVGEASADDSFFDSFRQGLLATGRGSFTIKQLRTICVDAAKNSPWLIDALPPGVSLTEFITHTQRPDSSVDYTEVHGATLCQHFDVDLYVLERNSDDNVTCKHVFKSGGQLIDTVSLGSPDTIYIINRGSNHFEPILQVSSEFRDVYCAIKANHIQPLEAALANHRSVLYNARSERQLEQCSIRDAILSYNIQIVDLLYEHWASAAYSAHSPHFHNLQRLGRALVKARNSCLPELKRDQQMFVDVHCIIEFNKFEVKLYQKLNNYPVSKPNDRRQLLFRMIDILIMTIDLYELYSDKNIRVTKNEVVDILRLQPLLNDKSTIYQKHLNYAMYEMYYRKLDFCVSKVILEYIHSLKEKLKLPENTYQNIECAIYYFLYRVNEEWRLYMPENRPKGRKHAFLYDTDWDFSHVRDDECRLFSGPVIYLEWLKFRKSLQDFKEVLSSTYVDENFREKGSKLPSAEVNSLTLLPYLRDEHWLRKVVQYLEVAERAIQNLPRNAAALIVQRVLQVTGECLKSTEKSLHLSSTTSALLQIYIPTVTLDHLHTLRNDFSKVRDGKLIRRINLEETHIDIILEAAEDLKWIKRGITEILSVYKLMVEKYLLDEGISLIRDRTKKFPPILNFYDSVMDEIQKTIAYSPELYMNLENRIIKTISESHGVNITRQFARELGSLHKNLNILSIELYHRDLQIISYVHTLLQPVNSVMQTIDKQIQEWTSIRNELEQLALNDDLLEYPVDGNKVKLIIDKVKTKKFKNQKQVLKNIASMKDYSSEWDLIKTILKYIVVDMDIFRKNNYEIKRSMFTNLLNRICNLRPDITGIDEVRTLLSYILHEVEFEWKINHSPISKHLLTHQYAGIKRLMEYMSKTKFITNKEIKYLKDKLNKDDMDKLYIEKILSGERITIRERDVLYTDIALDNRCKDIVDNLVIGSKRDECALQCLAQRAALLKTTIAGGDIPDLVQRYDQDECFRILIECILADIYTVHVERKLWDLVHDNMRLLAEFPIRNILDHGNPLLESIGKMLDSSDFPTTLFRFALRVVEDEPALAELARLYELGIKREKAEQEWKGPKTPRVQYYLKLLPSELGQPSVNNKPNDKNDANIANDAQADIRSDDMDDTNNNIAKKKHQGTKNNVIKDQKQYFIESGILYCIQYSKDETNKAKSFMKKLFKTESCQSKVNEEENVETMANENSEKITNLDFNDDSPVIEERVREQKPIKSVKYFLLTCCEVWSSTNLDIP